MSTPKHKIFVYGTLRPSKEATHILDGFAMFAVDGKGFNFPFIQWMGDRLLDETGVFGNIVEVGDDELAALDKYEGVGRGLYQRKRKEVRALDDDSIEEVWVYVAGPQLAYSHIESGDWLNR